MPTRRQFVAATGAAALALSARIYPASAGEMEDALAKIELKGSLSGSGSSFVAPWWSALNRIANEKFGFSGRYTANGSLAGVRERVKGTAAFGNTDAPFEVLRETDPDLVKPEDADKYMEVRVISGGIVPVVNIPALKGKELVLSREVLADILLNNITQWNDPRIVADNAAVKDLLPNAPIKRVDRANGSGTKFTTAKFVQAVNPDGFVAKMTKMVPNILWPGDWERIPGGNSDVTRAVGTMENTLACVDYADARKAPDLLIASMKNRDGKVVKAGEEAFAAAINAGTGDPKEFLVDMAGGKTWSIVASTNTVLLKSDPRTPLAIAFLAKVAWSPEGEQAARDNFYVPLGAAQIKANLAKLLEGAGLVKPGALQKQGRLEGGDVTRQAGVSRRFFGLELA